MNERVDVVVVGAGFGGLATALGLARAGRSVVVCETLTYPGGCASTFSRAVDGVRASFETGATLFSGLAPGGFFSRLLGTRMPEVALLDPVITWRGAGLSVDLPPSRAGLVHALSSLPGVPRAGVEEFFAHQTRIADALWPLFDDVTLLPPWSPSLLLRHLRRSPAYLPLLPLFHRPLASLLRRHGLAAAGPVRAILDGLCQITVQAGVDDAEALFALAAIDYLHRGTGHVKGGVGRLAQAFVDAVGDAGGAVRFGHRVKAVERAQGGLMVHTNRGSFAAADVVMNLLPVDAAGLCGVPLGGRAARLQARIDDGWSAVMLYLLVDDTGLGDGAHHFEVVSDDVVAGGAPCVEGEHVFVSVSARDDGHAPAGLRAVTVSTHVALARLRGRPSDDVAALVQGIQDRMRALVSARVPELVVRHAMTASPRTWQRFVGRSAGAVGGAPRRVGLGSYRDAGPVTLGPGLWLAGDSAFPGQSTLATTLGGLRLAQLVASSPTSSPTSSRGGGSVAGAGRSVGANEPPPPPPPPPLAAR